MPLVHKKPAYKARVNYNVYLWSQGSYGELHHECVMTSFSCEGTYQWASAFCFHTNVIIVHRQKGLEAIGTVFSWAISSTKLAIRGYDLLSRFAIASCCCCKDFEILSYWQDSLENQRICLLWKSCPESFRYKLFLCEYVNSVFSLTDRYPILLLNV